MTFKQIKIALYATFLTNYYGLKLKKENCSANRKKLRIIYALKLLNKLSIKINIINPERLPKEGQFLLVSNHRSIIDPLVIEIATQKSSIAGPWIAKKELYNSFFFGLFVRNGGSILLDRETSQMSGFFTDIKSCTKEGDSIYIFPEGTRNKSQNTLSKFKEGSRIIAIKNRLDIFPIFIKSNANDVLMSALKGETKERSIEVEIGELISYRDKSKSLEEAYKEQFNIF